MPSGVQTVAKKCTPFKIEFVVRGYLTGSTSTSIWMHYKAGARTYCGHTLAEGAPLPPPIRPCGEDVLSTHMQAWRRTSAFPQTS